MKLQPATFVLNVALGSIFLFSCAAAPARGPAGTTKAEGGHQSVSIYLGERGLDKGDWAPVEDQTSLGVQYSAQGTEAKLGWEIGFFASSDDTTINFMGTPFDVKGSTTELYGGASKTFGESGQTVRPFIGGGLTFINAEFEASALGLTASDDDNSIAPYIHGGLSFAISDSASFGIDLRKVIASDVELFGVDADADYESFSVLISFSF